MFNGNGLMELWKIKQRIMMNPTTLGVISAWIDIGTHMIMESYTLNQIIMPIYDWMNDLLSEWMLAWMKA